MIFMAMMLVSYFTIDDTTSIFVSTSFVVISYNFFVNFIAGPTGEELGWRGYVQVELQKRHLFLESSLILGFWWGIWHLPVWLISGFAGIALIKYGILFVIGTIPMSIVMGTIYNLNRNLFIPIIIHQLINFYLTLLSVNPFTIVLYNAIGYWIVSIVLIIVNPRGVVRSKSK